MILQRLRDETGVRHASLERRLPLLDVDLSRESYRDIVARFYGYYRPLERQLLEVPFRNEIALDFVDRLKTPQLEIDLRALGDDQAAIPQIPQCRNLPALNTTSQVLGCLYVVEGATLGGQVITKHLQANLGLTAQTGCAFFGGYGANTGAQWQAFRAMMMARPISLLEEDAMVASANRTFATMESWLFNDRAP